MPNIIGRRYLWFLISLLVIIPGIVAMMYTTVDSCAKQQRGESTFCAPLHLGIDFTGGTLWEITAFERPPEPQDVRDIFAAQGVEQVAVQTSEWQGKQGVLIRTVPLTGDAGRDTKAALETAMHNAFGNFQELRFESVGPTLGAEVAERAQWAIVLAGVGILFYIWWAFKGLQHSYRFGVVAVLALLHDTLVTVGVFSILGLLLGIEVDGLFLTAVLTVIGFSNHDTIVVFDRIRENRRRYSAETLEKVANFSIFQTLDRSLNTSLTVLFTLLALFLFGGVTTRTFIGALLVGTVTGVYSSVFFAAPLLVVWENNEIGRFFGRLRGREQAGQASA